MPSKIIPQAAQQQAQAIKSKLDFFITINYNGVARRVFPPSSWLPFPFMLARLFGSGFFFFGFVICKVT